MWVLHACVPWSAYVLALWCYVDERSVFQVSAVLWIDRDTASEWLWLILLYPLSPLTRGWEKRLQRGREADWEEQGTCLMWVNGCRVTKQGATLEESGKIRRRERRKDAKETREQTVRRTDRWFNGSLIKDVNEQWLTTNEGWKAVLADRLKERGNTKCRLYLLSNIKQGLSSSRWWERRRWITIIHTFPWSSLKKKKNY